MRPCDREGAFAKIREDGLDAFREQLAATAPMTRLGAAEITSWDQVFRLTVQINCLLKWYREGLLCIGDAAHAMSPAGGVGINLAIKDAVATASLPTDKLHHGVVVSEDLRRVQQRLEFPVRMTQALQALAHRRLTSVTRVGRANIELPYAALFLLGLLAPLLRRITARVVGIGFRTEHIRGVVNATAQSA